MQQIGLVKLRSTLSASEASLKGETAAFLDKLNADKRFVFVKPNGQDPTLFLVLTGGSEEYFLDLYAKHRPPYLIMPTGERNSLAASLEIMAFLKRKGLPAYLLYGSDQASMLKEAVATGEYTVEFHMTRPYSPWPYTMAVTGIVPGHAYDEDYGENPIGSGRYIMKQWDRGQQVIFEANPDYYGGEVKIKKVTVLFADEDAALAAAKAGQVDVAHTAPAYADSVTIDGYGIVSVESIDNRGINLPAAEPSEKDGVVYGNEFLSDVNVRRAINIGIDRERLIDETLGGHGSPAYSLCDKMPWYNDASEVSFDAEKAKELLEAAGWKAGGDGIREKDGVRAEFNLLFTPGDSVRQAIAENVASQLKNLGIEVTTESAGWDTAYDRAQSTPLVWGWGAHSPMELYNMYHTDENSDLGYARYSPYANDTVDGYMDMAMAATDTDEAAELWKKAQWDGETGVTQDGDVPWVWLCNVDHLYYVRDGVDIGEQKIHPHGHGWSLLNNVDKWSIG